MNGHAERGLSGPVKAFVIVPLILLVGGCVASRQTYQTQLNGWIGKTEAQLVGQFGPPERSEEMGEGKEILFWTSSSKMSQGSSTPIGGGVSIGFSMQSDFTCDLSFTLVNGIARNVDWKANTSDPLFGEREMWTSGECDSAFPAKPKE